jgi:iron complex transport system ATP-binding protein
MSLEARAIEVRYGDNVVVRSVDLDLAPGELVGLIGPNGAGKTSLLKALAGLVAASGQVSWQGRALSSLSADERARTIAYLPQSPVANWPLAVGELVELGRLPHRRYGQALQPADREAVARSLAATEMREFATRTVDTLSGGERMRAHLARAFAVEAPVLFVDEPVASLDPYHQLSVMQLLERYRAEGRLVVAVLHDLNLALGACSRLLLMDEGALVADGAPAAVIDAATLAQHYRIRAWLAEHEGRRVAVPWERISAEG